jgi:hypothetical protein
MNETTTTFLGTTGTATIGYSGTYGNGLATPLSCGNDLIYTNASDYNSISQAITNSNNMNKQTKVAVFTVERNEDNKVVSSKFVKELWVEIKNGASLELSVAKQLDKDFDPSTTIIKEISSVTF